MNPFLHFKHLSKFTNLKHAITTRKSGNIAFHVNDKLANVEQNHTQLSHDIGYDKERLVYMNQVHGSNVEIINEVPTSVPTCDAMLTNKKNIPLMVMVADCIPLIVYDPTQKVIGVIHAGRAGLIDEVILRTIESMEREYNSKSEEILVGVGPSITAMCYEIGSDLATHLMTHYGDFIFRKEDKYYFDAPSLAYDQLRIAGVHVDHIEHFNICNHCHTNEFYSYRQDNSTGRFAAFITLL
jgi:polyphenol oxidase